MRTIVKIKATQAHSGPVVAYTMGFPVNPVDQPVIYHVTNNTKVESIAQNGLIANFENRKEVFFNFYTPNGARAVANDPARTAPMSFAKVEVWPYKWEQKPKRDVYLVFDVAKAQTHGCVFFQRPSYAHPRP